VKSRLIDAAAFVIGGIPPFLLSGTAEFPVPFRIILLILSAPLSLVAAPIGFLFGAIGLLSFGFLPFISIVANGMMFLLISHVVRRALIGGKPARITLAIAMAAWTTWGVMLTVQAWSEREPPPPRVVLASPLAGRWGGQLNFYAKTLILHPREDKTLEGFLYTDGALSGQLWNGAWTEDSLRFWLGRIPYRAHYDSTSMVLQWVIEGTPRSMELHRASGDTTRFTWRPN